MSQQQQNPHLQASSNNEDYHRPGQNLMDQIVSVNMTLYRELGFHVTRDNFKTDSIEQHQQQYMNQHNDQQLSQSLQEDVNRSYEQYEHHQSYPQSSYISYDQGEIESNSNHMSQFSQPNSEIYSNYDLDSWSNHSHMLNNHDQELLASIKNKENTQMEFNKLPSIVWTNANRQSQLNAGSGQECPICLQQYSQGVHLKIMRCRHSFHVQCIRKWIQMNDTCPSCRNKLANQ